MRHYFFSLLLFISGIYSLNSFAQEEFFNDHNGLSFQYSHLLDADLDANLYAMSAYFKKGFIVGFAMENADRSNYPQLSILICPGWDDASRPIKLAIGPFYAHASGNHIIGLDAGLISNFLQKSNYPFSLSFVISPQMVFPQNKPPSDIYTGKPDNYHEIITVLGYGYTQALFTRSFIYPFIRIAGSYYLEKHDNFFSISAGLNLKLDNDPVR